MAKKIRDLNPFVLPYGVNNRFDEYFNLLLNAVKIVGKNGKTIDYATEHFVKTLLFGDGAVGYDKILNKWYYVYGQGINEIGNPTKLTFVTANGKSFVRVASYANEIDGAYRIFGLPTGLSMANIIRETTDFMTNCDIAMRQNLEASKTPFIVVCKNKDLLLSFEQALQQKIMGQACIIVNDELGDGLKAINVSVEYLVDRFSEARDRERDTLLNKLGIMTANINKKERVQSAEVNATIGEATDYIYLLIDTFNKQCETYGIDYEMQLNGALEEIYFDNQDNRAVNTSYIETNVGAENENV